MTITMASNGNAHAGPSRHRRQESVASEEEDVKKPNIDEEEVNRYTIEHFVNVPVGTADDELKPLREVKGKLQLIVGRIENSIGLARDTAMAVEQASPDDEVRWGIQSWLTADDQPDPRGGAAIVGGDSAVELSHQCY